MGIETSSAYLLQGKSHTSFSCPSKAMLNPTFATGGLAGFMRGGISTSPNVKLARITGIGLALRYRRLGGD